MTNAEKQKTSNWLLALPTPLQFRYWFEYSLARQSEDRAWAYHTSLEEERRNLEALIPKLLPQGMHTPLHYFRVGGQEGNENQGFIWFGVLPGLPQGSIALIDILVNSDTRSLGLGRYMLTTMLKSLKEEGYQIVVLEVRQDNEVAIDLYTSVGFTLSRTVDRVDRMHLHLSRIE
ncbi:MAG: GNAT family N-acetyltransferase [Negativicutes bacterium]|nr:GNAT family N-acetyltransferase [Negativicutes bacterium]